MSLQPGKRPLDAGALDDEAVLCSIEILAEAVEMAFVPGILELRTLRDALQEARRTRSPAAVQLAYSAFSRVDGEFRSRISHHALTLATLRRRSAGPTPVAASASERSAGRGIGRGIDGPRRA
ncbi:hypothetical protein [Azospirillum lipoferum]|uniref:Uncharacterized protein n=1 Tax=Azospirillum lipoferum (strain 4B) TaxID=862719 RepID=G7Z5X9_AZOL4|nr:hypothetical protein [Azospirillum lipoferum]CBS86371.1 protein of unknown function [Azospirillum lipoferum 4B]